jgi:hypothetical protein
VVDRDADRLQSGPEFRIGRFGGDRTGEVRLGLRSSVSVVAGGVSADLSASEVVGHVIVEGAHDPIVQGRLVSVDGPHVIGTRLDDRSGDFRLTAHGVDRDQTAGNLNALSFYFPWASSFGDGRDLVALGVDHHLSD